MKIRYLGFIPLICLEIWTVNYLFFTKHEMFDALLPVAFAIFAMTVLVSVIIGIFIAVGLID